MELANDLCDIADKLDERKFYRFAEQLRSAAMSISNNIAEGWFDFQKGICSVVEYCPTFDFLKRQYPDAPSNAKSHRKPSSGKATPSPRLPV